MIWVDPLLDWWANFMMPGDSISIHMQSCSVLDSTMLGTLALLHHQEPTILFNFILNDNQVSYYDSLGLMGFGTVETSQGELSMLHWKHMIKKKQNKTNSYKNVQQAHEALASLKEGNLALFRDLMKALAKPPE